MAIEQITPIERANICAKLVGTLLDRTHDIENAAGLVRTTVTAMLASSYDHDHPNDRHGAAATLEAAIAMLELVSEAINAANNADARRMFSTEGGANV